MADDKCISLVYMIFAYFDHIGTLMADDKSFNFGVTKAHYDIS